MRSQIVKRSFVIAGQKKSISLEEAVWGSLKEIATNRDVTLLDLLTNIASTEYKRNLSSAIRLFVLNFYREQLELQHIRTACRFCRWMMPGPRFATANDFLPKCPLSISSQPKVRETIGTRRHRTVRLLRRQID